MNLRELIEFAKDLIDEDPTNATKEVGFAYNYGDHWRTTVVQYPENMESQTVVYSEYHQMDKLPKLDEDGDEEFQFDDVEKTIIVLRV